MKDVFQFDCISCFSFATGLTVLINLQMAGNSSSFPTSKVSSSLSDQSLNLTSPAHSTASNDLDYMDGSISGSNSMESSPSKSTASNSASRDHSL